MLLKSIARILVKYGGNAVGFGVAGDAVLELWDCWNKEKQDPQEKLAEVQQLAQQTAGETRQMAADIVLELAADQPEEVRQTITSYLTQVPAMVRRSLRRPGDPTGTTIPPGVLMTKADDLRTLLPTKVSRFKPGDRPLAADWELVELLGVGGFGEVWKARNPFFDGVPNVALKFCLDSEATKALRHEGGILNQVMRQGKHPGIVQLLHSYLNANPACLEYEYVEGGDLAGLIQDWHRSSTGFPPDRIARLMFQLAEIVGFAHRLNPPIVHRDLKPANILVQKAENGEPKLKVADFGIGGVAASQAIAESRSEMTRGLMAATVARGSYSPLYASLQQMAGMPADPRDDVYALGVIWYQLLIGNLNRGAPSGDRWKVILAEKGMDPAMITLLTSCFEEPEYRLKDAAELAQQLETLLLPGGGKVGGGKVVAGKEVLRAQLKRFWEGLLSRPKAKGTRHANSSPTEYAWITAGSGVRGVPFGYVIGKDEARVEIYIDRGTGRATENKRIFDLLREHQGEIEAAFGGGLSWQRLDDKGACRIAYILTAGGYKSDETKWPEIQDAMIDAMIRLDKALTPHLESLPEETKAGKSTLTMEGKDVAVVAAREAWPEYLKLHAYVCQPNRAFQQVKYLAFYAEGKIQATVPAILRVEEEVLMQRGLHEGQLGELVARLLDEGLREEGKSNKVFFLSAPDDLEHTIKLDQPVENDLPTAFTMGQRYVSLAELRKAKRTSELVKKAGEEVKED